jgi:hypothetical protein
MVVKGNFINVGHKQDAKSKDCTFFFDNKMGLNKLPLLSMWNLGTTIEKLDFLVTYMN